MRQRPFKLCVCGHRRRVHYAGKCEDCERDCIFKEGDTPNTIGEEKKKERPRTSVGRGSDF